MEGHQVYKKSRILAWVAFVGLLVFASISVAYVILGLISNRFSALLLRYNLQFEDAYEEYLRIGWQG